MTHEPKTQEMQVVIKITSECPLDLTREEIEANVKREINMLSRMIGWPVELLSLKEEAEIYGTKESLECDKMSEAEAALRFISEVKLWGEPLTGADLETAKESHEVDDENNYNPCSDTETNNLRDIVEMARSVVAKIDQAKGATNGN